MNGSLKQKLELRVAAIAEPVASLDDFLKSVYETVPAADLQPTQAFMEAWEHVKTIRQILTLLKFEDTDE